MRIPFLSSLRDLRVLRGESLGIAALTASILFFSSGCAGHANLNIIPMRMNDLDPSRPLISTFHPGECYYRIDEQGKIQVAMRYRNLPLFGPMSRVIITFSLVLDEPPAGRARTYRLRAQELRGWAQAGPEMHRFRSTYGVAVIHDVRPGSLRGKFRAHVRHQTGNVLTGWRGNNRLLLMGDFNAVKNDEKTRELIAESEADDWARPTTL